MLETLIIGGGLVGTLTALHLASAGQRCAIIDRHDGPRTASDASAGGIYQQLQPLFESPETVSRHGSQIGPLIQASLPAWFRLCDRFPEIPIRITGGVVVGFNDIDMDALYRKHRIESSIGLRSIMLSGDDIRYISPDFNGKIRGGCYAPDEGHCNPKRLMAIVREALSRLDVPMLPNRCVERIEPMPSVIRLRLSDGAYLDSDRVILATGGFTGTLLDRLGIRHGIRAFPIQMCQTRPTDIKVPVLARVIGRKLSLKQLDDGRVWIGGGWEAAAYDEITGAIAVSQQNMQRNISNAVALVPKLGAVPIDHHWGGWVAWTTDGLPILGSPSGEPRILMACGGNGFSLGPLYAELLADIATSQQFSLALNSFSVDRFHSRQTDHDSMTEIPPD